MENKKQSASWNIAATHWLTSGFVVPFIINIVVLYTFRGLGKAALPLTWIVLILPPIVYWLGVMYSASYINKKYIITNSNEIALLSTIYLVVIVGGFRTIGWMRSDLESILIDVAIFVISVIVFYFASKKYIKNTQ